MVTLKRSEEIARKAAQMPGAQGVFLRRLITQEDGAAHFVMRLFEVEAGGHTPRHRHAHEHEVYILSGRGSVVGTQGEVSLQAGSAVFVPPQEEHQFINGGSQPLVFLCMVPATADG